MSVQIRQGAAADIPAVHELVKELAAYVDALPEVEATVEEYRQDFADGFFQFVVAEEMPAGRIVGVALYVFVYSTWKGRMIYLEDFVVGAEYRRRGIGQRLWEVLKIRGRERGCRLLKWQIAKDNTEALKFYAAQEATIDGDWLNGKLPL